MSVPTNPLKLGATIQNFDIQTTTGDFKLHEFLNANEGWTILFTHPNDFTPVCTTELGRAHKFAQKFKGIDVKMIGLSCNTVDSHKAWTKDIMARESLDTSTPLAFPIIADEKRSIVSQLGMLDPEEIGAEGLPMPARAAVVLHGTTVKCSWLYPATTGRNFDEMYRAIVSMQLTANKGLATPVDWKYGDRCVVAPPVTTADAKAKFEDFQIEALPSEKEYLRTVKCPVLEGYSTGA